MGKDKIKGGLADKLTKKDISDKFNISIQKIEKELRIGTKVEMEHVNSKTLAKEIAMDHLVEFPDYYTRLKKMEEEAKKKWGVKESIKNKINRLLKEEVGLKVTDETPDVSTYKIIYNGREVGTMGITTAKDIDKAMEIVFIELRADHQHLAMKIITEVITALWETFTETQRILLTPKTKSKSFWHKMGANRLNDDFLMLSRGH